MSIGADINAPPSPSHNLARNMIMTVSVAVSPGPLARRSTLGNPRFGRLQAEFRLRQVD
jgi:hypothetical protein